MTLQSQSFFMIALIISSYSDVVHIIFSSKSDVGGGLKGMKIFYFQILCTFFRNNTLRKNVSCVTEKGT